MSIYVYPNNTEIEITNLYVGIPNPESITLDKSSISLTTVGQTEQLTATVEPTLSDHSVTWTTSDSTVATVSTTGLVTCVTPGTCTITATTSNGLTATCSVGGGWQPGANTIAYWKLETDGADYSGNNYNLTLNGITFQTSGNLKYAEVTTASQNCYQPGVFTQANVGTGDFCLSFWFNPVNPGSKCPVMFLDSPDTYPYPGVNIFFDPNDRNGLGDCIMFRVNSGGEHISTPTASSLYNGWHNVVYTRLNGTCYAYIDGVSVITSYSDNTNISQLGGYDAYVIGGNGTSQTRGTTGAKFSNMICENVGWTAQNVSDYFDQTKGDYGIS